jgi:hypothetical protein
LLPNKEASSKACKTMNQHTNRTLIAQVDRSRLFFGIDQAFVLPNMRLYNCISSPSYISRSTAILRCFHKPTEETFHLRTSHLLLLASEASAAPRATKKHGFTLHEQTRGGAVCFIRVADVGIKLKSTQQAMEKGPPVRLRGKTRAYPFRHGSQELDLQHPRQNKDYLGGRGLQIECHISRR